MNETATEEYTHKPLPEIRSITVDDVYASLSEGWADFKAAPQYGLFFGGIYALLGIVILLELWIVDQPLWIVPLALAFPLVGPFAAIGLYEVSRRRELGEPLDWSEILGVVWRQRGGQMPFMAFIILAGFMIWIWVARLIVALFLGRMSLPVYSDFSALLATGNGIAMVVIGTVIGGVIAFLLYSITVVALPLLLDREIDFVSAMITSFKSVLINLHPMLIWAGVIATALFVAMIPFFLGLIVALPVLGHATWHLYRKLIVPEPSAERS
jgi:uncharacterized membrane protein